MKKILTYALCLLTIAGVSAQNPDKKELEQMFKQGQKAFSTFDGMQVQQQINPQSVDKTAMSDALIEGYNIFMKLLPLDSIPNEKGQVKPKYSKKIVNTVVGHVNDFNNTAALTYYNDKKFYPQAYEAFMIYADMPDVPAFADAGKVLPDSLRATGYFNAGIMANSGNELLKAANAFMKARTFDPQKRDAYVYEIASWQNILARDSSMTAQAEKGISDAAEAGYKAFGIKEPIFINNMINNMVNTSREAQAIELINRELASNPNNANLYGLLGFTYSRMNKEDESVDAYRKAAAQADADFETLLNAANKIFRVGQEKWNALSGNEPGARNEIKTNYFEASKKIAEQAQSMAKQPSSKLDNLLENINYVLTTYFPQ
jgi:hypothetical protein